MALLYEMDPYSVEQHYVLPAIEDLKRRIKLVKHVGITHFLRYIRCVYRSFTPGPDRRILATINDQASFTAVRFIRNHCANLIDGGQRGGLRTDHEAAFALFVGEFGRKGVSTRQLTTASKFVRMLFDTYGGMWGGSYLREVLSVESPIRKRHEETQSSIEAILGQSLRA